MVTVSQWRCCWRTVKSWGVVGRVRRCWQMACSSNVSSVSGKLFYDVQLCTFGTSCSSYSKQHALLTTQPTFIINRPTQHPQLRFSRRTSQATISRVTARSLKCFTIYTLWGIKTHQKFIDHNIKADYRILIILVQLCQIQVAIKRLFKFPLHPACFCTTWGN